VLSPTFRQRFLESLGLRLDRFQEEALGALDDGASVLVAAPTGSGKTIVALYGMAQVLSRGRRAFYTSPLKALSNQKYHELARFFGGARVGLLTGDTTLNPDAPAVVMTTEVLRNMIYATPQTLDDVDLVVLDEVHYLQNPYRGSVWEEVIIHLPRRIRLVSLSATVSNVSEFAGWLEAVRGDTRVVEARERPVPLEHRYVFTPRRAQEPVAIPILVGGRENPQGARLDPPWLSRARTREGPRARGVHRAELVEFLAGEGDLPAIVFIFSRSGCERARDELVAAGIRLTTQEERQEIRRIVDERLEGLAERDLGAVGFSAFLAGLEAGIAPHHAGMIPPFREVVEACFERALVKVVFATETLSLGINMPARAVVIERLVKFDGESHQLIKPGEYTQFAGRAGRRGIDERGRSYVVWGPQVSFGEVAHVVRADFYPITSSFRPTYNMAANLIKRYSPEQAAELLDLSFAQFQRDAEVVRRQARARQGPGGSADALGDTDWIVPGRVVSVPAAGGAKERTLMLVVGVSERRGGGLRISAVSMSGQRYRLTEEHVAGMHPRTKVRLRPHRGSRERAIDVALARLAGSARTALAEPSPAFLDAVRTTGPAAQRVPARQSEPLSAQLRRVVSALERLGLAQGWRLTEAGERLAQVYVESDLAVVRFVEKADLGVLGPAELAAVSSWFVYEPRPRSPRSGPWPMTAQMDALYRLAEELSAEQWRLEAGLGLPRGRGPEPGLSRALWRWARGEPLGAVLDGDEMAPGDFVRSAKQVSDLLRQIAMAWSDRPIAALARASERAIVRGVVALSSEVVPEDPGCISAAALELVERPA